MAEQVDNKVIEVNSDLTKSDMEAIAAALQRYLVTSQRYLDRHPDVKENLKKRIEENRGIAESARQKFSSFAQNIEVREVRIAYSCVHNYRHYLCSLIVARNTPDNVRTSAQRLQKPSESAFIKLYQILSAIGDIPAYFE